MTTLIRLLLIWQPSPWSRKYKAERNYHYSLDFGDVNEGESHSSLQRMLRWYRAWHAETREWGCGRGSCRCHKHETSGRLAVAVGMYHSSTQRRHWTFRSEEELSRRRADANRRFRCKAVANGKVPARPKNRGGRGKGWASGLRFRLPLVR